jgi:predicted RNA-binding Zn-ribbon protein involved in translation (DUF1610 family)
MKTTLRHASQSAAVIAAATAVLLAAGAVIEADQSQPASRPAATQPVPDGGPVVPRLRPVVLPLDDPVTKRVSKDDDARAAQLAKKLLGDPLDTESRDRLFELRARLRRRDAAALDALACGLWIYLDIGPQLAAGPLKKAADNSLAKSLTIGLGRSLEAIVGASRVSATGEAAWVCPKCGDTGFSPCTVSRCNGSGYVPCDKCGGLGEIRGPDSDGIVKVLGLCPECGGTGVVSCQVCGGTGSVACRACKPKPSQAAGTFLPASEIREIQKAICKARWIRAGGVDLYTNGARATSPK